MSNLTKIISLLTLTGFMVLLIAPGTSYAADEIKGPETPEEVIEIIAKVGRYMFTAFFIVAIIFIIIAAFNFLTAQGDVEKVKNARNQILWAAVAIAVALISTGIVEIVKSIVD